MCMSVLTMTAASEQTDPDYLLSAAGDRKKCISKLCLMEHDKSNFTLLF